MSTDTFRQEMRRWSSEHPLFQTTHPFWRACFRGRLQRDDLRRWGFDVYPFVRDFPRFYLHVATKCESLPALTFLSETIFEETGCGKESEAHSNLFKRFLGAIELSEEQIMSTPMTAEGKAIWDFVGETAREGTFLEGLAAVGLGIERPLPNFFPLVAKALIRHYGLTDQSVEFFSIHSVADVKHSQLASRIISEQAQTRPLQQRAREIVFHLWDLQKSHLDRLHEISLAREKKELVEV